MSRKLFEESPSEVRTLVARIAFNSYVADDELETRVNMINKIDELSEGADDARIEKLVDDIMTIANELTFEDIGFIHDQYQESGANVDIKDVINSYPEEETVTWKPKQEIKADKDKSLFDLVFQAKKKSDVCMYIDGKKAMNYKIIKTFSFEDEYYALLEDYKNRKQGYYKYQNENDSFEIFTPVDDQLLLHVFEELKL